MAFYRSRPYPKRMFWYILALMCAVSVVSCIYFGSYISARLQKDSKAAQIDASLQLLERVQYEADDIFRGVVYQMNTILWEDGAISLLVNPGITDRARIDNALERLNAKARNNDFTSALYLYSMVSGTVYSSRMTFVPLEYSISERVIRQYLDRYAEAGANGDCLWRLISEQGNLYLALDIRLPDLIGVMLCQLNSSSISRLLQLYDATGRAPVYVYSEMGDAAFSGLDAGVSAEDFSDAGLFVTKKTEVPAGAKWFRVQSPDSGLIFLAPFATPDAATHWYDYIVVLLPILALFLGLSLGVAYIAAKQIYNPIEKMIDMTLESPDFQSLAGTNQEQWKSEMKYLTAVFDNALRSNKRYRVYAEGMSHDMAKLVFMKNIYGRDLGRAETEEVLLSIGEARLITGAYYLVLCRFHSDHVMGEFEQHMANRAVFSAAERIGFAPGNKWVISSARDEIIIVLYFPEDTPLNQAIRQVDGVSAQLEAAARELQYVCTLNRSAECNGVHNLRNTYRNALRALNFREYAAASSLEEAAEADAELAGEITRAQPTAHPFHEQIERFAATAQRGNITEAEVGIRELLAEVIQTAKDIESVAFYAEAIVNVLREKVAELPLTQADVKLMNEQREPLHRLAENTTAKSLVDGTRALYLPLLQILAQQGRKKSVKYVENAKHYISQHYSETSLSLNDVAEAIGISPHYLSRLFMEISNISFISTVNKVRVDRAKRLLELSTLPISEIGFHCGFGSAQSFCRIFKKYAGVTPGQFRSGEEADQ